MKTGLRHGVAYIAQRVVNGVDLSAIYDYDSGAYYQFSGDTTAPRIDIYDYSRGCFIGGDLPSLYDYGEGNFIDFKLSGGKVDGYDYGSSSFFEATVSGKEVSVYDYDAGAYFSYSA